MHAKEYVLTFKDESLDQNTMTMTTDIMDVDDPSQLMESSLFQENLKTQLSQGKKTNGKATEFAEGAGGDNASLPENLRKARNQIMDSERNGVKAAIFARIHPPNKPETEVSGKLTGTIGGA